MIKTSQICILAYTGYKLYNYFFKEPAPKIPLLLDIDQLPPAGHDQFLIESFVYAGREEIGRIALVCKKWRDLTESNQFYKLMWKKHESEVFGEREWKRYYGDPGEVREIPQRLMRLYCRFPSALIWKPSEIVRPDEVQPHPFDIRTIAAWSANPLPESEGHAINLHPESWQRPHEMIENDGKAEWLLVSRNRISEKPYWRASEHRYKAHKLCKGEVGKIYDVCLFLFTEKMRTGDAPFSPDPQTNQIKRIRTAEKLKWTYVRIHEESHLKAYSSVIFNENGIRICSDRDESRKDDTGFLVIWKEEEAKLPPKITKMTEMTFG